MALKFKISKAEFDELDEATQALYVQKGDDYELEVEGIDTGEELKEALRKEREERARAKAKLKEMETEQEKAERERLESQEEWKTLAQQEREKREGLDKELKDLRDQVANGNRKGKAEAIVAGLIDKEATGGVQRYELLKKEALAFISHTPEGTKINGPDGEAWTEKQLGEHLSKQYPFLVDGSQATGGGAPGSKGGGSATKKLSDMSEAERIEFKRTDPEGFRKALHG